MKISGTDAEHHEESENSIEIVQKSENYIKNELLKMSFFLDPQIDDTPNASFRDMKNAPDGKELHA